MDMKSRILVFAVMLGSMAMGVAAGMAGEELRFGFATLHVFLFNLTAGGLVITAYYLEKKSIGLHSSVYLAFCLLFAFAAFFHIHEMSIATALILAAMVEYVRWRRFAWFPFEFFEAAPASRKFEQAALLCLSMGLIICAATILNNEFLQWVHFEKLNLHVFFLGFSFPISLTMFSLIFKGVEEGGKPYSKKLAEFAFWALNLGVIIFFVFIIFENFPMQMAAALTLFSTVIAAYRLHLSSTAPGQEKGLKTSALAFLTVGSVTGIAYIIVLWMGGYDGSSYVLSLHSATTLFGWNLTCVILLMRRGEFPLRFPLPFLLILHWAFVTLLPQAREHLGYGIAGTALFAALLSTAFFSNSAEVTK